MGKVIDSPPSAPAIDPTWAWTKYDAKNPGVVDWDIRCAGHLLRRTTFGFTHEQLQAAFKDGPHKTIERLLQGSEESEAFEQSTAKLADSISRANNGVQASAWWLYRMLYTPHPLREKMTLFWHNHFATSNAKVQHAGLMLKQYDLLHKHALGNFRELLLAISYDPAMLVWLDGKDSKKGNPNENYARELMELFSLGIGNYTEKDIREAARAFTGWDIKGTNAVFTASQHDATDKTVFKKTGKFKPDDIVKLCLDQPSAPYFILHKLWRFLMSDSVPPTKEVLEPLAVEFRKTYDFGAVVKTMVSSNLFFSSRIYRTKIKSPVDFALGIVHGLEGKVGTVGLVDVLAELGQNVFQPPSVKGWDGGTAWLNGQTLLYRQNLALALTSTEDGRFGRRTDPAALLRKHGKKDDTEMVDFLVGLFLQGNIPGDSRAKLLEYLQQTKKRSTPVYWTEQDAADSRARTLCHLVLTLPEFQLD